MDPPPANDDRTQPKTAFNDSSFQPNSDGYTFSDAENWPKAESPTTEVIYKRVEEYPHDIYKPSGEGEIHHNGPSGLESAGIKEWDSQDTAVDVWQQSREHRDGGAVVLRDLEPLSQEMTEMKILELYRCETVLLNFAKELRKHMHNSKNNCIRMHVWSDYVALQKESTKRVQSLCVSERKAVAKIDQSLPFDNLVSSLPGVGVMNRRLRVPNAARNWRPADSKRLTTVVGDFLMSAYAEYNGRVKLLDDPEVDLPTYKKELVGQAMKEREADDGGWKVAMFAKVSAVLDELIARAPKPEYERFWETFWDRISVECSVRGSKVYRSGRECQIQWVHFLHPASKEGQPWTKEEESCLLNALDEFSGSRRWEQVAAAIGTGRSVFETYKHYQTALNVNLTTGQWTEAEIKQLEEVVDMYRSQGVPRVYLWAKVASHFPNKSNDQCRLKYESRIRTPVKHGRWTIEEDFRLQVLVAHYGRGFWQRVARGMPFRTDIKCRERYENVLAPDLVKSKWTENENRRLLEVVRNVGPGNWSKVQTMMPGRTDFDCARQWAKLDPVGNISLEGVRTVKSMFFPKYTRLRGIRPTLTSEDFKLAITGEVSALWQRTVDLTGRSSPRIRSITSPDSDDQSQIYYERLDLLKYFIDTLFVSAPRMNPQLERIGKAIIRRREAAYGVKIGERSGELAPEYKRIIEQIVESEISVEDFCNQPEDGKYFPNISKFQDHAAQRVLGLISAEINMKPEDIPQMTPPRAPRALPKPDANGVKRRRRT